jgi:glycerol-3-phosphate dehydrogenase subunit B
VSRPVVVIGAGIAGVVAAARVQHHGLPVILLHDRPGATWMHGGGWYLGLDRLGSLVPGSAAHMGDALAFVDAGLAELELADGPFRLLDTDGAARVVDWAPINHAAASAFEAGWAVVDLAPLGHPFARMASAAMGGAPIVEVAYPEWPAAFGRSFAAVATRLDADPAEAPRLFAALRRALDDDTPSGLLLPPVLGVAGASACRWKLVEALELPVAEALGTTPSTPGLRLSGALSRWLDTVGVEVRRARVDALDLDACIVRTADGSIEASGVVLATGGALTAGLIGVTYEGHAPRVAPEPATDLLRLAVHPEEPYGGELFTAGLAVDRQLRPVRPDGAPIHPRVFAAGDVLGGVDAASGQCASGRALLSGFVAAEHLAASHAGASSAEAR